jgi:hypothetical protein
MTWLYIPPDLAPEPKTHASSASRSAPARAGLTLGSPSPSPDIVLWAMSNGKPCLMTSLGSFAIREPLPGTAYMPGSGGGRIEGNQVLHHRGVV